MLNRLFPPRLTNAYQGSWLALWLFLPVLLIKTLMGVNFSGLNPFVDVGDILRGVDGVPLDDFPAAAAESVTSSAAAWGVALLALCLFGWVIVVRYRGGLPLAILVVLLEQVGRSGAHSIEALVMAGGGAALSMAAMINITLSALLILGFALSLLRLRDAPT